MRGAGAVHDATLMEPAKPKPTAIEHERWFERLKRLRLRFKRKGLDVEVTLEDPAARVIEAPPAVVEMTEAEAMSAALKAVLDRQRQARSVLVHLAVFEKALHQHGLKALDELPPHVMQRAMFQLDTLVSDWSGAGLAGLRAQLTSALIRHEHVRDQRAGHEPLSDFDDGKRLQVDEASVSDFMAANAKWQGPPS